ncbi:glycosyltransferase [Opitutaceae bacterium EW11]|nr:glycosyltransferase [Opitutaceae bacterium EW11]
MGECTLPAPARLEYEPRALPPKFPHEISVVIPCLDESATIGELVERLASSLHSITAGFEIIVVDDGSRDATPRILSSMAADRPWLKVIRFRRSFGQTAALMAGFRAARGSILVAIDADLQNDPADIDNLLAKLGEGYDVVSGWRVQRNDQSIRRVLLSRVANRLISFATGVRLHDFGCTLKAYRREILEGVNLYGEMHRFIPAYASYNGARIAELPVRHRPRRAGSSHYGLNRVAKVILDLLVVVFLHRYAQKPIYVFGACGFASLLVSGLAAGAMVYFKFWGGKSFIETPLPWVWSTMFFIGVLCFLLGLIAEVVMRIYHEGRDHGTYRIATTFNFDAPKEKLRLQSKN